jgi:uncharacterized protein
MKKIIITGGSGFLGSSIIDRLLDLGKYEIVIMDVFPPRKERNHVSFFKKDLSEKFNNESDYSQLQNPYAVIHLAGKSIYGRFTKKHKQGIWDSRIEASRNLVDFFTREEYKPQVLVAASAVGFYGNQPDVMLSESSSRKNYYYLSDVVQAWEAENLRALDFGIKVHCVRNGHIIGNGGILSEVAKTFVAGVGTVLGSGKEVFPWIDIRDLVTLYILCIENKNTPTIINGVSMQKSSQRDFSYAIGKVKKTRWYILIFQWMLSLKFGNFAKEMLVDQYVISEHYQDIAFSPQHTQLDEVVSYYLIQ